MLDALDHPTATLACLRVITRSVDRVRPSAVVKNGAAISAGATEAVAAMARRTLFRIRARASIGNILKAVTTAAMSAVDAQGMVVDTGGVGARRSTRVWGGVAEDTHK